MVKKLILFILVICVFMGSISAIHEGVGSEANVDLNKNSEKNNSDFGKGEMIEDGRLNIQIQEQSGNRKRIHAGNSSVLTDLNLTQKRRQNRTRINASLSNGRNAEIKIMPDTASEVALEKLKLRVCSEENNCSLELKEVGKENQIGVAYELKAKKKSRILGLFRARMQVESQVNAETGDIMDVKKPWWAFLATESEQ